MAALAVLLAAVKLLYRLLPQSYSMNKVVFKTISGKLKIYQVSLWESVATFHVKFKILSHELFLRYDEELYKSYSCQNEISSRGHINNEKEKMHCHPCSARVTGNRQESKRKDQVMDKEKRKPWIVHEHREEIDG
jgi:hypothetical protein